MPVAQGSERGRITMVTNVLLAKFTDQGNPQAQGIPEGAGRLQANAKDVWT